MLKIIPTLIFLWIIYCQRITFQKDTVIGTKDGRFFLLHYDYEEKNKPMKVDAAKLAGIWSVVTTTGWKGVFTIKWNGEISVLGRKSVLQQSDNQVDFPSSEGWMKDTKLHRDATWNYYHVDEDGKLEIQHFCTDTCNGTYNNLQQYCCSGTGSKVKVDPAKLAGVWSVATTNGWKGVFIIKWNGEISLLGKKSVLEQSDNQVDFPSSEGWMKVTKLHRDTTWNYYRVDEDGKLEFHHFCTDACNGTYNNLQQYCCSGTGSKVKVDPAKLAGVWSVATKNGWQGVFTIKRDGGISLLERKSVLQQSDNQLDFPSSEDWMKAKKLHRDTTWNYYRVNANGKLEIHHFCTDICNGTYNNLQQYCCSLTGSKAVLSVQDVTTTGLETTIEVTTSSPATIDEEVTTEAKEEKKRKTHKFQEYEFEISNEAADTSTMAGSDLEYNESGNSDESTTEYQKGMTIRKVNKTITYSNGTVIIAHKIKAEVDPGNGSKPIRKVWYESDNGETIAQPGNKSKTCPPEEIQSDGKDGTPCRKKNILEKKNILNNPVKEG